MRPRNVRTSLPRHFASFALITLSALILCSPLFSGARSASAVPARFGLAGPVLAASPTNLTGCRHCTVTVSNESPARSLTWSASSRGLSGVTIKPTGGKLQPRGHVSVTITLPSNITCPTTGTIILSGPVNSVKISWSCLATPTPTPTPTPVTPTPTTAPPPSPTPSASRAPTDSSLTPTATSVPNSGGQQKNGNPPGSRGSQGSSVPSILLSVAALLLALLAFSLFLISTAKHSLSKRLHSLILPASFLRRLDQNQ